MRQCDLDAMRIAWIADIKAVDAHKQRLVLRQQAAGGKAQRAGAATDNRHEIDKALGPRPAAMRGMVRRAVTRHEPDGQVRATQARPIHDPPIEDGGEIRRAEVRLPKAGMRQHKHRQGEERALHQARLTFIHAQRAINAGEARPVADHIGQGTASTHGRGHQHQFAAHPPIIGERQRAQDITAGIDAGNEDFFGQDGPLQPEKPKTGNERRR
jgi:hypothetical protein